MNETYKIPEQNLVRVRGILSKLNRRAERLDVPQIAWNESERYYEERDTQDEQTGRHKIERRWYVDVEIIGEEVKLNGWHLLARVVHMSEEGNLLAIVPGHTVPERFRTVEPRCDHCNTVRWRKDTFLVEHEDGTVKQVGSSCLHDFLGHDPHRLVAYQSWLSSLETQLREAGCWGGGWEIGENLVYFLQNVAAQIKLHGYRSSGKCREEGWGEPTGGRVFRLLTSTWRDRSLSAELRDDIAELEAKLDDVRDLTCATLYWLGTLSDRPDLSDYLHNLKIATSVSHVTARTANIVASAIVAFEREHQIEIEKTKRAERRPSEYVGVVGERIDVDVEVSHIDGWPGDFGYTHFYRFYGPNDEVIVWFGSTCLTINELVANGRLKLDADDPAVCREARARILARCGHGPQSLEPIDLDDPKADEIIAKADPEGTVFQQMLDNMAREEERKTEEPGWTYSYASNGVLRQRDVVVGERLRIRGTVKRQEVRPARGRFPAEKQTILSRVIQAPPEKPAKKSKKTKPADVFQASFI